MDTNIKPFSGYPFCRQLQSNRKDNLAGITWQQATTSVGTFNTIATLVYHMHYYVDTVLKVLQGGQLNASDTLSFSHLPIPSQYYWNKLPDKVWADAEDFDSMVELLPEDKFWENFSDNKYRNCYRIFMAL